jgi:hypothetical protein
LNDKEAEKSHLLYSTLLVENIAESKQEGEKERGRDREKRWRDRVWLRKGCDVCHKFDSWLNSPELIDN